MDFLKGIYLWALPKANFFSDYLKGVYGFTDIFQDSIKNETRVFL